MMESPIVVIHKEGKDPLKTSSYRPISLLNTDIKILVKVLAARLNRVIRSLSRVIQATRIFEFTDPG